MTDAPSAASDLAIAAPIPLDAPVTIATFPVSLLILLSLFWYLLNSENLGAVALGGPALGSSGVDGTGLRKDSVVPNNRTIEPFPLNDYSYQHAASVPPID